MSARKISQALVITAFLLAASGSSIAVAQPGHDDATLIHAYLSDFDLLMDRTIIPAGEVRIEAVNLSGQYKHEMWIYPIDERDTRRFHEMLDLKRTGQRADELTSIDGILGRSGEVQAGEAMSFSATLPPGFYEVACLAREGDGDLRMVHYDEGMYAILAVRAPVMP
ncbi:MAG: hypothetical protein HW416_1746 [Chloroflexi bacterium]|nr:hypothetical protein [Chloroflexota bacterium]